MVVEQNFTHSYQLSSQNWLMLAVLLDMTVSGTLPSNLNRLVKQVYDELNELDNELAQAIELIRERMRLFPDNIISIQIFAILNNYLLFADNTRRRMQATVQYITMEDELSYEDIQEAGEDFSEQLGRVLEAKIVVNGIRIRLEN